jgi:hypothetical protein
MRIHADKIESIPPHGLSIRNVKRILAGVPADWISGVKEVRLANSLEYYRPYAYIFPDGCLMIYSRRGTKLQVLAAVLSALAVKVLGINRGINRRRSRAEQDRISQFIQPLVEKLLPEITPVKKLTPEPLLRKLSPEAHVPWIPAPFEDNAS